MKGISINNSRAFIFFSQNENDERFRGSIQNYRFIHNYVDREKNLFLVSFSNQKEVLEEQAASSVEAVTCGYKDKKIRRTSLDP